MAGKAGVPAGATAAQLTVTVTDITAPLDVTVWPAGRQRPNTSVVNATPLDGAAANSLPVMLGAGGAVDISTSMAASIVVDVAGAWEATQADAVGGRYEPVTPSYVSVQLRAGQPAVVAMPTPAGAAGTVTALALSLDVQPLGLPGFVAAWPTAAPWPGTSLLNHHGIPRRSTALVPTGADGAVQMMSSTDAVVNIGVLGRMVETVGPQGLFVPATPTRVLDTRVDLGLPWASTAQVPASGSLLRHAIGMLGAVAVLDLTTVGGEGGVLAGADGTIVHFRDSAAARADTAYMPIASDGTVSYSLTGRTHVIADLVGTFTGPALGVSATREPIVLPDRPWAPAKRRGTPCETRLLAHLERHMPEHLRWVLPYVEIRVSGSIPAQGTAAFANYRYLSAHGFDVPRVGEVSGPMTTLVVDRACRGGDREAYLVTHEAVGHLVDSLFDDIDGWQRAGGRSTGLSFNGLSPMMPAFASTSPRRAVELFADCVTVVLGTAIDPHYTGCTDAAWRDQAAAIVAADALRITALPLSCTVHAVLATATPFESTLLGGRIARGDAPSTVPAGSSISTCTVAVLTPFGTLWGTTDQVVILATPDGSLYRPVMTGAMAQYG